VSLKRGHGEMFSIQHYVIKFVSDLQQVSGFLWVKLTATEIVLKVGLNTLNLQTNILFISETIFVMELLNDRNVQTLPSKNILLLIKNPLLQTKF
jgi:hypothetical protein